MNSWSLEESIFFMQPLKQKELDQILWNLIAVYQIPQYLFKLFWNVKEFHQIPQYLIKY